MESHFERFDQAEKKYARSMYDPIFSFEKNAAGRIVVDMKPEVKDLSLHYSLDHSYPGAFDPAATGKIEVPKDAVEMRVISYRAGKPIGRMISFPITEMQKRIK